MGDVEFIVAPAQTYAARELAETLLAELTLQGMPGEVSLGEFPGVEARGPLPPVYVIVDPARFLTAAAGGLPERALLRRTIVVWTEGPPAARDDMLVDQLRWAGAVFATDQRSVASLHRAGVRARLLRAGYSARLDHFDSAAPRTVDVAFIGVQTPRRDSHLLRLAAALADSRLRFDVAPAPPRADEPEAALAAPRWNVLAATEILLGIHAGEDRGFPWASMLDGIHAGAVVVCEPSSAIAPLVPGEHLFVASAEAMPHVVRALLRDPDRLRATRQAAYERLRDWIPYALWASVLRAAVVELIGEPLIAREQPLFA